MKKSAPALYLLFIILLAMMTIFGCLIYEAERGTWQYTHYTEPASWQYMRKGRDQATQEITPFVSIPASFWWFIVTATTVGYGDFCPTSPLGKCIASVAILLSLLVVAFPISVFSQLWEDEFKGISVNGSARGSDMYGIGEEDDGDFDEDLDDRGVLRIGGNGRNLRDMTGSSFKRGVGGGGVSERNGGMGTPPGGGGGGGGGRGIRRSVSFRENGNGIGGGGVMDEVKVQMRRIEEAQRRIMEILEGTEDS